MTKSRIFLVLCLAFIGGVFAVSFVGPSLVLAAAVFVLGGLVVTIGWYQSKARLVGFLLIVVALGIGRYSIAYERRTDAAAIAPLLLSREVVGVVVEPPARFPNRTQLTVRMARPIPAKILVTTRRYPEYRYGDRLKLEGRIAEPGMINGFDYQSYLAKEGIQATMFQPKITVLANNRGHPVLAALYGLREEFLNRLHAALPSPHGSLAGALIVGERASLPDSLLEDFRRTGLTHIIAISGFNFFIVLFAFGFMLRSLAVPYRWQFAALFFGVVAFALIAGATASVIRAAVMGVLAQVAVRSGRQYRAVNAIIFAGLAMIALNPLLLRWDAGFQLSFLATLGLVFIGPIVAPVFRWLPAWFGLRETVIMTLSAQLAVLPLTVSTFNQFSFIAPVSNLIVVPFIPYTMAAAFGAGLAQWLAPAVSIFAAFPAWLLLQYEMAVARGLSHVSFASMPASLPGAGVVALYALLVWFIWRLYPRPKYLYPVRAVSVPVGGSA
ncbi:ComEC/Rec2 family competence protein [Candidatus Parcubacteria bacterium]|nr:ComEC/Rec2 family competence protein [Candidatus Parcubacteria bacterium]